MADHKEKIACVANPWSCTTKPGPLIFPSHIAVIDFRGRLITIFFHHIPQTVYLISGGKVFARLPFQEAPRKPFLIFRRDSPSILPLPFLHVLDVFRHSIFFGILAAPKMQLRASKHLPYRSPLTLILLCYPFSWKSFLPHAHMSDGTRLTPHLHSRISSLVACD